VENGEGRGVKRKGGKIGMGKERMGRENGEWKGQLIELISKQ